MQSNFVKILKFIQLHQSRIRSKSSIATLLVMMSCISRDSSLTEFTGFSEIGNRDYLSLLKSFRSQSSKNADAVFLNFKLNDSRKITYEKVNQLFEQKIITHLSEDSTNCLFLLNEKNITHKSTKSVFGYRFWINQQTQLRGYFRFYFDNELLKGIEYVIIDQTSIEDLEHFISKKYGKSVFKTISRFSDEYSKEHYIMWIRDGLELTLTQYTNSCAFSGILYSDLDYRIKLEEDYFKFVREYKADSLREKEKKDSIVNKEVDSF